MSSTNIIIKHRIYITNARFTVVFSCQFKILKKSIYRYKLKVYYYVGGKVMYVVNGRQLRVQRDVVVLSLLLWSI